MRLTFIQTGKTRENYLLDGIDEYLKRIKRYASLECITIPDMKKSKKVSETVVKQQEGQQIMQRLKPADNVVLLDESGSMYTSVEFAKYISALQGKTGHTVFITGGAYGFSEEVYARADARLSLSAMTFSHQMVRLIFTEQLYRAFTIINGEPYHHS
ncbi:MAG: 23S rRNA (pseudouridine(1915)-N(3))-methyltransferase RlmH [Bacteroidales bacterium]